MEIFLLAAGCIIAGIVIGYRLCLYVHRPRTSTYNRRWLKWRKKQPNCCMCDKPGAMMIECEPGVKNWFCQYHFLGTHQPGQTKGGWICDHPALVTTARKK